MSTTPPDELLRLTPLFRSLERGVQDELLRRVTWKNFQEGEVLLSTGEPGRSLLILLRGKVEVQAREGSTMFRVALLESGAFFGEMAFFDPAAARTAHVVGRAAGVVANLPHEAYAALARTNPAAAANVEKAILAVLADRLEETNRTMAQLMDSYRSSGLQSALVWLGKLFGGKG